MITITVTRQQDVTDLAVSGHAGQASPGEDIVCAGTSALVETLVLGLQYVAGGSGCYDVNPGRAAFHFTAPMTVERRAIVETIVLGLRDLAGSYPEFVRFVELKQRG